MDEHNDLGRDQEHDSMDANPDDNMSPIQDPVDKPNVHDEEIETITFDDEGGEAEKAETSPVAQKQKKHFLRPENIFPKKLRGKLGKIARPLASLVILLVLVSLFLVYHFVLTNNVPKPIARFQAKTVSFGVVSTLPSKDQKNVDPASPITVTFNQPVDPKKLASSFFVSPTVAGNYTQGKNKDQVTFTPSVPFAQGTKVQIMINGTFQSEDGSQLGADYFYGFTTSIPDNGVLFQDQNGLIDTVSSVASGQKVSYTLLAGNGVNQGAKITLYKADMKSLLNSLIYKEVTNYGFTSPEFVSQSVDTTGLSAISTQDNVTNNSKFSVDQADGIYLAVATDASGKQLGYVWIDVANFGVLLRQDDQKLVLDAQSLSSHQDVMANATFYNLNDGINTLDQRQINGITPVSLPLSPSVDVIVATYNGDQVLVPVSILNSQGDIRADKNLSTAQALYGLTDKPTYEVGDTVHLAGFVRQDNDAQYTLGSAGLLHLYVADPNGNGHMSDFTATVSSNGTFAVDLPTNSSWLTNGDTLNKFQVYAVAAGNNPLQDVPVASFTLTNQPKSNTNVKVVFTKSDYLSTDSITANITATDNNGTPLANASVDVHVFSKDYYENNPGENYQSFGDTGSEVKGSPFLIRLDSSGKASFNVQSSELPNDGYSQVVTVQANIHGTSGAGAAGGASAVVHQGNGQLVFGIGSTVVPPNGKLVGRVYAETLSGNPLPNAVINYSLSDNSSPSQVIASGNVTADTNGFAMISANLPSSVKQGDGLTLKVTTKDSLNNQISAVNYYYVQDPSGAEDYSGAQLGQIDVYGSSGNVKVGDKLNLTINVPSAMRVMMTMDRGRIYDPQMLNLSAGDNSLSFTVTKNLAPSFTITFAYFENGTYHSEGVSFNVSEPAQRANLTLSATQSTVTANQPVTMQLNATDSTGKPLQTNVIVDVVDSAAYNLTNPVVPSMYDALYSPRVLMTSSSSSLTNIGSGGGKCGGGGFGPPSFANALSTTLFWQPNLTTDTNGTASFTFTPPSGSWQVNVYTMDGDSIVGSISKTILAN